MLVFKQLFTFLKRAVPWLKSGFANLTNALLQAFRLQVFAVYSLSIPDACVGL
jgi:hypothetical protein